VQGKQAGVPANGNQRHVAAGLRRRIHGVEVIGDSGVGIEAVHGGAQTRQPRPLHRQIVLGAATQDQHIDGLAMARDVIHAMCRNARCLQAKRVRIPPREHGDDLHVGILRNRQLDAASQIAVTDDTDPYPAAHVSLAHV